MCTLRCQAECCDTCGELRYDKGQQLGVMMLCQFTTRDHPACYWFAGKPLTAAKYLRWSMHESDFAFKALAVI